MKRIFLLALPLLFSAVVFSQHAAQRLKDYNVEENGLAISGYDPVAYFTLDKAIQGKKEFAVSFDGLLYYFSSKENKELFKESPAKYEPQYGGWCAYAMGSTGEKVEVDPQTFKIKDGKLFLFYNKYFNNTLKTWNKNETALYNQANINWKKIN